jgi:hypothetical protein
MNEWMNEWMSDYDDKTIKWQIQKTFEEQEPTYFHWDLSTDPILESIQYWVGFPL